MKTVPKTLEDNDSLLKFTIARVTYQVTTMDPLCDIGSTWRPPTVRPFPELLSGETQLTSDSTAIDR
jgi:hypothetical protein